jgi:RimJ/RimL family protein N-acetyltransferase
MIIKQLNKSWQNKILEYCYKEEYQNLFVIGSFDTNQNPFDRCIYIGAIEKAEIIGLAVYFKHWRSLVVHAENEKVIKLLIDEFLPLQQNLEAIPAFKKHGDVAVKHLVEKHGIRPQQIRNETVYQLSQSTFKDYSTADAKPATENDLEQIIYLIRTEAGDDLSKKITEQEIERANLSTTFVIRQDNQVVAKANLHGRSKRYFQIGGVITHPLFRNQGLARCVVSALCKYHFDSGLKHTLLFTGDTNLAAQRVYSSLGFLPIDRFLLAEYSE